MRIAAGRDMSWVRGIWATFFVCCLGLFGPALAQTQSVQEIPVLTLGKGVSEINAEARGLFWTDDQGQATVEQVAQSSPSRFQPMRDSTIYTPGDNGALWLHYRVMVEPGSPNVWLLAFPIPVLDRVTLYQREASGQWQAQSAGDTLAVDSWPEPGRYPFFRLSLAPGVAHDLFVRIQHMTPVSLPVRFTSQAVHDQHIQTEYLGLGMAFGALVLLIAACIAQAWVYRDRAYAWYASYAVLMTLAVAAYTGVAGHILWSSNARWTDQSQGALALMAAGASLLFVRHLAGIAARFRRINGLVYWAGWSGLALTATYLWVPKPVGLLLVGVYVSVAAFANIAIAWAAWRRGDSVGLWVLAAYTPLCLAVMLVMLRIFGALPISFATQYAVVLGSALEVPLLLVALSIRSRERHGAQIREQALANQDALTGLLAGHLFHDRLRQVVSRFSRERQSAAVLYIDLVNYARIKSTFGVAVAEQSLLRSVIKLRRLVRDVDTVSRVGEARFGVIMEGVNARAVITDRAARLIAAGLMPLQGLKPDVILQFHIVGALLDDHNLDAKGLASALGDRLQSMSPRTRRPIRFLEPERTHVIPLDEMQNLDDDPDTLPPHQT
jgi:diguanylate cyclase (GGDEF)-like protein